MEFERRVNVKGRGGMVRGGCARFGVESVFGHLSLTLEQDKKVIKVWGVVPPQNKVTFRPSLSRALSHNKNPHPSSLVQLNVLPLRCSFFSQNLQNYWYFAVILKLGVTHVTLGINFSSKIFVLLM